MDRMKWGRLEVGTSMTVPPGADASEFERKLRATAQKKRLSIKTSDLGGIPVFTCVPLRKAGPEKRNIVPGKFPYDYQRIKNALTHYRTAKNHGFESHFNKVGGRYIVTVI